MPPNTKAKLLRYRLARFEQRARPHVFDLNQFTQPVRDTAYSLGACIVGDDELQRRLFSLLKPVDTRNPRRSHLAHDGDCPRGTSRPLPHALGPAFPMLPTFTAGVNTLLLGRGETVKVPPEKAGWMLRALGLRTDFLPRRPEGSHYLPRSARKDSQTRCGVRRSDVAGTFDGDRVPALRGAGVAVEGVNGFRRYTKRNRKPRIRR